MPAAFQPSSFYIQPLPPKHKTTQPTKQLEEGSYFHWPTQNSTSREHSLVPLPLQPNIQLSRHLTLAFPNLANRAPMPSLNVPIHTASGTNTPFLYLSRYPGFKQASWRRLPALLLFDCLFIALNIKIFQPFKRGLTLFYSISGFSTPLFCAIHPTLPIYSPKEREERNVIEVVIVERVCGHMVPMVTRVRLGCGIVGL